MYLFNSGKEKMLMRGDFDLNSVQRYADSLKEVMKQTMLKQEFVFRKQVWELHRLYGIQQSLMKDLGGNELETYNSWNLNAQSSPLPLTNSTRNESQAKETKVSTIAKGNSDLSPSREILMGCQDTYHLKQLGPLDLQLSAEEFINHVEEDLPKKGNVWNCVEEPINFNDPLPGSDPSGSEELKLSLSIRKDNGRMGGAMRTWFDKKSNSDSQVVIDLEKSVERISDGTAKRETPSLGVAAPESYSKGKNESKCLLFSDPIIQTRVKKEPSHEIVGSSTFQEYCRCQEQTSSNEGTRHCHDVIPCNGQSTKMLQFTSYQEWHLDLNKVHLDDFSGYANDVMPAYRSTAISSADSAELWKKEVNGCANESSGMLAQGNIVDIDLVEYNSKNKSTDIWARDFKYDKISGPELSHMGSESISRPPLGTSEDFGGCRADHNIDDIGLKLKHANGPLDDSNHTSIATREVSCEQSEVEDTVFSCADQSQNTVQDGRGDKSPASCKSCISDNDSSSVKTAHSDIVTGALDQHPKTDLGPQVTDALSGEQDLRTSDGNDKKSECYNMKDTSSEVDIVIQRAAESLLCISLENSACYPDSAIKGESKPLEDDKREQPQYSYDSFELVALTLTESNTDDNSVSSKPFEVNEMATKDFGFKLRRGRRLKDFQKEILPGLASLSRHEIREDINIMEAVLRSREYRKIRAKMAAHGENWSVPVKRSRRSRLSYVGRRNFS